MIRSVEGKVTTNVKFLTMCIYGLLLSICNLMSSLLAAGDAARVFDREDLHTDFVLGATNIL